MKSNKHLAIILTLSVLLSVALSSCGKQYSEGLEFESNGDGTCTWIGLGACEDTEIMVPEKNGEDTVTAVGPNVLNRKEEITKVVLPDTVKVLKEEAFDNCDGLLEIDFGSGLETIEEYGVAYCEKLETLDLPDSVRTIGDHAFYDDTALLEILIPEGVESVGSYAFANTSSVKKISIPASMNEFISYSFCTTSLEEIEFKGENKYFDLNAEIDEESKKMSFSGSLCQDYQSAKHPSSYEELSDASYPSILCAILGKDKIKLNGKEIERSTTLEAGIYQSDDIDFRFEITENQELMFRLEDDAEDGLTYESTLTCETNEETKEITVKGTVLLEATIEDTEGMEMSESITLNLEGTLIPLGDKFGALIHMTSPAFPDEVGEIDSIWSKV